MNTAFLSNSRFANHIITIYQALEQPTASAALPKAEDSKTVATNNVEGQKNDKETEAKPATAAKEDDVRHCDILDLMSPVILLTLFSQASLSDEWFQRREARRKKLEEERK